jgi:hypothetical protein
MSTKCFYDLIEPNSFHSPHGTLNSFPFLSCFLAYLYRHIDLHIIIITSLPLVYVAASIQHNKHRILTRNNGDIG